MHSKLIIIILTIILTFMLIPYLPDCQRFDYCKICQSRLCKRDVHHVNHCLARDGEPALHHGLCLALAVLHLPDHGHGYTQLPGSGSALLDSPVGLDSRVQDQNCSHGLHSCCPHEYSSCCGTRAV